MSDAKQHCSDKKRLYLMRRMEAEGPLVCTGHEPDPQLKDLVERGYCRFSRARCGPAAVFTGQTMIGLTEAGRLALEADSE